MRKPRLTARVARGLGAVYALADVNLFEDSDLFSGADTAKKQREVEDAVSWLGNLLSWYENRNARAAKGGTPCDS